MGLSVSTDMLADIIKNDPESADYFNADVKVVNKLLRENGLPEHTEPTDVPASIRRDKMIGFPYSFLHYLRRAYAHRARDASWMASPLGADEDPGDDPLLDEVMMEFESHLLCHSDAEGYYVPIEFVDVIFDDQQELAGGMLGSTHMLKKELQLVAPALGITLQDGELTDVEVAKIDARIDDEDGLEREIITWVCLFEACNESLKHGTAICFT